MKKKGKYQSLQLQEVLVKQLLRHFLHLFYRKNGTIFESKDYWNTTEHTKKHAAEINDSHEAVVLEYGMAYPGVITEHCSIIQPTY